MSDCNWIHRVPQDDESRRIACFDGLVERPVEEHLVVATVEADEHLERPVEEHLVVATVEADEHLVEAMTEEEATGCTQIRRRRRVREEPSLLLVGPRE